MSATLALRVASDPIDRVSGDLAIVGCFEDERPLRGAVACADWRMCGAVSGLLLEGSLRGREGEAALFPSPGGVKAPRLLALGLGPRSRGSAERLRAFAGDALLRVLGLRARQPVLALLPTEYGSVAQQIEDLVAGLATRFDEVPPETALRLYLAVPQGARSEARRSLAALAAQRWPSGFDFPGPRNPGPLSG